MNLALDRAGVTYTGAAGRRVTVFRSLSLSVRRGECIGITGSEGAGKSTLLALLAGLLRPTSGRVLLEGVDPHAVPERLREYRRSCAVAFQFPEQYFLCRTVEEEVLLASAGRPPRLAAAQALAAVGLDHGTFAARSPWTLSAGEARRVALAALLPAGPEFVFLDEPSAGLDAAGIRFLSALLARLRSQGATLLIVSHDAEVLAAATGRVVRLEGGEVAGDGPTEIQLQAVRRSGVGETRAAGLR